MKRKISSIAKKSFRIPFAVHIYSSLILITVFTVAIVGITSSVIIRSYIDSECTKAVNTAVTSCSEFSDAFRTTSASMGSTPQEIRENLLNAIVTSADVTTDASIALFEESYHIKDGYDVLWPDQSYSVSAYNHSDSLLNAIISKNGISLDPKVKTVKYNNSTYYYRFIGIDYSSYKDQPSEEYDNYYLLIFINSNSYYSYTRAINNQLIKASIISIIASAFISIIASMPLFASSRRLTKFAGRIGKGDFTPMRKHIVSRELQDLGDSMNDMADKLEKADTDQKIFFQNASHELRTPLMSIQGYAEGLKYDVFDEAGKEEAVNVIISETSRLSNLVENLLSISKMDMSRNGNYEVKKQMLDALEIADILIDKVRGSFLHESKDLINDIRVHDTFIMGNENDIFRMLENIISNCLRYCKKMVKIECYTEDEYVVYRISDDGPGIAPEVLEHLFDRFAKGSDGKHGIGLALAKAIAIEHQGTIDAYNIPDSGACFEVKLPITAPQKQLSSINNNSN